MEFDCLFWSYCLGSTSVIFLLCVVIECILLIRSRRKISKIKSAYKKLKSNIVSAPREIEAKRRELDALKISRRQGTPLPIPEGDNIENPYDTIKPKEKTMKPKDNTLLAARDSVGDILKEKLKRKRRNKVTFSSEQYEVIPHSVEQITSKKLEERSHSMSHILEELPAARQPPSSSKYELTYMTMHRRQKSKSEVNLDQAGKSKKRHGYPKCEKPPELPRGSNFTHLNSHIERETEINSKKIESLITPPVSSNSQNHQTETQYNHLDKVATDDVIVNMDCEDDYDEDEMYDKELEKYIENVQQETSEPKSNIEPILPNNMSLNSESQLLDAEKSTDYVANDSSHDETLGESYDFLPVPRPLTIISSSDNELVPPTPHCDCEGIFNSPSPTPSKLNSVFWNYCLGLISIVLLLIVMIQCILLICCRKRTSRISSEVKKLQLDIESGLGEKESKQREMDVLKIARKQGTPLPTPKGDNLENLYETIKPKENTLLAVRDSLSVRLKDKIMNRKGRNKIVTFSEEQFEIITDSLEQIASEGLEESPMPMSDILETDEFATNLPSTSGNKVESTYIVMHGSQKTRAEVNLQTSGQPRETSHVYAKCQKPPPLPCSRRAKLNPQGTVENKNVSKEPVSSNSPDAKSKNQDKTATGDGILHTDGEDEFDEDEMYNKEIENYLSTDKLGSLRSSNVQKEWSDPNFMDRHSTPILPKKMSLKSKSKEDVHNESGHDATSLESYDVLPIPRPVTTILRSGNELVPPTPYCGRKFLYNSPSPTPSRKSNISEKSISNKKPQKSKMAKKLKKMEDLINKSLRWKSKSKQDEEFGPTKGIGSLVQNSFYSPTGSNPILGKIPSEERKPSLSDINRLQERLNMTNTSSDRLSSASSIATPPILRRTSNVSQANNDE
ncbi:hypothetical protein LOTGIDRAFT_162863 [Lottia gigantea]|uniref:Uncharacterized protein n=1 Tax=Lottia gigantea TaxID=225164 RepID=V4A649_LOTGI|nr:hypothetical protein LOTGIDRAFT_162863 [Lottia gigantea]ESO92207.1 hypothetical protein LOTGIDRAFT_162863 [Lottia gigantea]